MIFFRPFQKTGAPRSLTLPPPPVKKLTGFTRFEKVTLNGSGGGVWTPGLPGQLRACIFHSIIQRYMSTRLTRQKKALMNICNFEACTGMHNYWQMQ